MTISRRDLLLASGLSLLAGRRAFTRAATTPPSAQALSNANATGHEVSDLRALRPLAMRGLESLELRRRQ